MLEELKTLYDMDKDFRDYVEKFRTQRGLSKEEALRLNILKNYGDYCKEKIEDKK